jgi:exosortase J
MSSLPAVEVCPALSPRVASIPLVYAAVFAAMFSVLGLFSIWSAILPLWAMWTTDGLKSIGMLIPIVSIVLIARIWRSLHWEMQGHWSGLLILAATILAVHIREQSVLIFVLSPQWSIYLPPHSLVVFAYAAGMVLLFGGTRLFRAALFPIFLLLFVNPVPHVFNVFVDLPLQRISAHVARAFAIALGQPLSPDQMRLMFTPDFGMFIAPGCNGIRGAVTMGFIALIVGYLNRFRWYAHVAVVAGAILLGYVFNFARLCILVLYYIVALHIPWLQNKAEMGDYIIGGCLFLIATFLLFYVVNRLGESSQQTKPQAPRTYPVSSAAASSIYLRLAAMFLIALFGGVSFAQALSHARASKVASAKTDQNAPGEFPARIGTYTLTRTWNENLVTGALLFHWADYAPADGGPHVSIGISPVLGSHDTIICHSARGEDPSWHSQLTLPVTGSVPVYFSASFFSDGATQYLEATTICNGTTCGEYSSNRTHFGLVYSRPPLPASLFNQDPGRPIPILLKAETLDTRILPDIAREQMIAALRSFIASINLDNLTQPYRHS